MKIDKATVMRNVKEVVIFALIASLQTILICKRCNSSPEIFFRVSGFTFLIWFSLWKGNAVLASWLSTKISWFDFPVRRFFVGITSTIVYTVLSIMAIMKFFEIAFDAHFGASDVSTIYSSVVVTVIISLFMHGKSFFSYWRQATLEKEKFEKESIAARYESLKNQVNPHFLFNSLNALSNLVYEDQDKAVKFIKQLSEVYRYVLDTRDQEVVPVKQELRFLDSYLFLQQIRFGDNLLIQNELTDGDVHVTPLALQMLIENAIKHNVISSDDKLTIRLYYEGDYVCVENNLQRKRISLEPSAGVGLENIRRRYELLSIKPVIVEETESRFIVRLPITLNDKYEDRNHRRRTPCSPTTDENGQQVSAAG